MKTASWLFRYPKLLSEEDEAILEEELEDL